MLTPTLPLEEMTDDDITRRVKLARFGGGAKLAAEDMAAKRDNAIADARQNRPSNSSGRIGGFDFSDPGVAEAADTYRRGLNSGIYGIAGSTGGVTGMLSGSNPTWQRFADGGSVENWRRHKTLGEKPKQASRRGYADGSPGGIGGAMDALKNRGRTIDAAAAEKSAPLAADKADPDQARRERIARELAPKQENSQPASPYIKEGVNAPVERRTVISAPPAPDPVFDKKKITSGWYDGGHVSGPGSGTSDSIPAWLSDGEYVLPADTTKKVGIGNLDRLLKATHKPVGKNGKQNGFADGGNPWAQADSPAFRYAERLKNLPAGAPNIYALTEGLSEDAKIKFTPKALPLPRPAEMSVDPRASSLRFDHESPVARPEAKKTPQTTPANKLNKPDETRPETPLPANEALSRMGIGAMEQASAPRSFAAASDNAAQGFDKYQRLGGDGYGSKADAAIYAKSDRSDGKLNNFAGIGGQVPWEQRPENRQNHLDALARNAKDKANLDAMIQDRLAREAGYSGGEKAESAMRMAAQKAGIDSMGAASQQAYQRAQTEQANMNLAQQKRIDAYRDEYANAGTPAERRNTLGNLLGLKDSDYDFMLAKDVGSDGITPIQKVIRVNRRTGESQEAGRGTGESDREQAMIAVRTGLIGKEDANKRLVANGLRPI